MIKLLYRYNGLIDVIGRNTQTKFEINIKNILIFDFTFFNFSFFFLFAFQNGERELQKTNTKQTI